MAEERTEGMWDAEKGKSLWADAWGRLRKNKMAMAGLVVTVVMSFVSITAEWISPFDPEAQQRWTGALPPWSEMLTLRNEMRFETGVRPAELEVPEPAFDVLGDGREHRLAFEVQQETISPVRIIAGSEGIERLEIRPPGEGILRPARIDLGETEFLRLPDAGARLPARSLEVGGDLPAGVPRDSADTDRFVVKLDRVRRSADSAYSIDVDLDGDGVVSAVSQAGESLAEFTLPAADVVNVTLDGTRLTHLHVLGTDQEGRDTLSRLIFGGQISLLVGVTATIVSLVVGVLYGAFSGFVGGRTDALLMRIVDVLFGLPYLFLVILLLVAFGRSIVILFIALGLVQWLTMARIVRGQVLSLREKEFVDAAVTVGTGRWGILVRHLIPNTLGVVVVYTTLTVPAVILQESFLAFLGLTVEMDGRPLESWGALVNYGREALGSNGEFWWLLLWPSIAMAMTLFSLNFLGDGLRDALDPQQRGRG